MPDLLSSPLVVGGVLVVVAYVLYQKLAPRLNVRVPKIDLSVDGILSAVLGAAYAERKTAAYIGQLKRDGNFLAAGKIYEDDNKLAKAVEIYLEGDEKFAAAATLERMGRHERAGELFLQAGDYKKAAEVYVEAGKAGKAARLYEEKGNNLDAARLYEQAGQWQKAGDLFVKSGYPNRAAPAYEKAEQFLKAADCHAKHFMENVSYGTTYAATSVSPDQKSALLAGRLYEKAGRLEQALEILSRGEYHKEAARISIALGQLDKAAELFLRAEDNASAADAYEKAGEPIKAANLRGEVAFRAGNMAEAAAFFQQGEDYLRAAELFESVDMLAEAAGAFEEAQSFAAAGGVYIRAGMKDRAAAAYERGGEYETAAKLYDEVGNIGKSVELFSRAGLTFKGGEAAAKAGRKEEAIKLLQRVPPSDESYRAATVLLVQIFIDSGRPGLALERLQKVLGAEAVSADNLDLSYWLGVGHAQSGHVEEATAIYKKILAEDFDYRDVQQRLARLRSSPSAVPPPRPAEPSQPAPVPSLATGPRELSGQIGKYEIIEPLGRGAMGMVYLARDTVLEREVALKVMVTGIAEDPDARRRFEREAKAVAKMTHPNVVTIHDLGYHTDGSPYIAMERLRGSDLQTALREKQPMELERKVSVVGQVLAGLAHAHSAGVVHRDIKPANIFLVTDGPVTIMDFGIARLAAGSMTETGGVVGTADYMSPEQVRGQRVDGRSDLFSVGCVFYELLAGRRPFQAENMMTVFYKITHEQPDFNAVALIQEHAPLATALRRALEKDRDSRHQSAFDFAMELRGFLQGRPGSPAAEQALRILGELQPPPTGIPAASADASSPMLVVDREALAKPPEPEAKPAPPPPASTPSAKPAAASPPPLPKTPSTPPVGKPAPPPVPKASPPPAPPPAPPAKTPAPPPVPKASPPPASPPSPKPAAASAAAAPKGPAAAARFVPKGEIGRGPLGRVLRAEDRQDGRSVALRLLPAQLLEVKGALQALVGDLKLASRVSHPNVARVLGLIELSGERCLVAELVEGKTCAEPLKAGRRMTLPQLLGLARTLGAALSAIHAQGLSHGSIQPSNIMLASGKIKLADLGLGRLARSVAAQSPYRAPENQLNAAGDVFALSAALYHLFTGKPPTGTPVAPPGQLVAGTPQALDEVLVRGLDPQPETRFASVKRFLEELGKIK